MRHVGMQKKFLRAFYQGGYKTYCLSMARGNGKSYLAAYILYDAIWPESRHYRRGQEMVLLAASLKQAKVVFGYLRNWLAYTNQYSWTDSSQEIKVIHKRDKTSVRVISSNGKTAMGIVNVPLLVGDEPGSWEVNGGHLMYEAIKGAQGKPGSPLTVLYIGTQAPANQGWWINLCKRGTWGSTYVKLIQGDKKRWDDWNVIRKANPLTSVSPEFRETLLEEREEARTDTSIKAFFLSYRLNIPSADESEILLTDEDWSLALDRPILEPEGMPVIGVDLGQGRSWSAAVAVWPNGRVEAFAVAPGIPSLEKQEERDKVPRGTYTRLEQAGMLHVTDGKRVQPIQDFVEMVETRWPEAEEMIADRFRVAELEDYTSLLVHPRVTRWSEAAEDIRALRKWAKDGPMNVEKGSRKLITASLMVSMIKSDDQGNTRLVKRGTNAECRDDVSAAMLLGVGHMERETRINDGDLAVVI